MTLTPSQLELIRESVASLRPAALYLFGSAATRRLRPGSDFDLALLPSFAVAPLRLYETQVALAEKLGRDVDLVDLSRASTVLRKEVMRTGSLLLENDAACRRDFEMCALRDYARLNEERAPVLAAFGQPLEAYAG